MIAGWIAILVVVAAVGTVLNIAGATDQSPFCVVGLHRWQEYEPLGGSRFLYKKCDGCHTTWCWKAKP